MRTFVFALFVLIVSAVNGQSDKDNYSLGVTVRFKYGRMVDSHMVTKTFYNSELNPTRSIGYDKKGSKVSEWKYEYKDNRLVKKIFTSKKYGREVTEYIYNDQGNEVQEKKYSRGKLSSATKSEYHNSKLIKRQDFAGKDSLTGQLYMTYDDNGNRIKQIYVDAKGDTVFVESCNYGEKTLTRCAGYSGGKIDSRTELYLDENGRRLKTMIYQGELTSPESLQTIVFFDEKDRVKCTERWDNGKLISRSYNFYNH